jgi:hypothetical protein
MDVMLNKKNPLKRSFHALIRYVHEGRNIIPTSQPSEILSANLSTIPDLLEMSDLWHSEFHNLKHVANIFGEGSEHASTFQMHRLGRSIFAEAFFDIGIQLTLR